MEMVLQRPQDIGERIELLSCQGVSEVLFYGSHMGRSRAPEDPRSLCSQDDLSTAVVGGAVLTADQTPSLHPLQVVG
jgi:hypothetical protein